MCGTPSGESEGFVPPCAVLIPVLDRPERVQPLLESLRASEPGPANHWTYMFEPVFICSPHDRAEIRAVEAVGLTPLLAKWTPRGGDYAKKMNLGWRETSTEWVFLAADDLQFHTGWFDEALAVHAATGACVIGTNDLGNSRVLSGKHSTHTLVHRDYGECGTVDDPSRLLHEGYDHNFVDDEFIQTAQWRGTYAHAERSLVEHLHPSWSKGHDDATYRKGMRQFSADRRLLNERRHMWNQHQR